MDEKKEKNHQQELEELKKKCEEYLNNWKRAAADLVNYKKDEMERVATLLQYGKEDIVDKFLPVIDSIYYATKHIQDKGLEQVWQQAVEFFKKEGIEEIEVIGKKFDPATMEAVEEVEIGVKSGTVVEELQKGYMMQGKVLRPAKVKVSK